jgi:EmrB/QacA subfamily drug resistance transporter
MSRFPRSSVSSICPHRLSNGSRPRSSLVLSVLLLVGGRLADIFGRKRLFTTGLWAYALLAFATAAAPSPAWLILFRGLQGAAGALLVPTTLALINATFPPEERGKAIGTWAAWSGITTVLGPIVGGYAIDTLSWRYAFLLAAVVAAAALVAVRGVPESADATASRRIDIIGSVLVVFSLTGVVYALIEAPVQGWDAPQVTASLAAGILLLPVFIWWQTRAVRPVLPLALFGNRNLTAANAVTFFVYAGLYGSFFYVPIYMQSALGASATAAATIFVPVTVLLFFLSPVAGRLNDRYGPRWLMCGGPLLAAAGLVVASFTRQGQVLTLLVPGIVIFGIGLGFTVVPVTATAIGAAEDRYSGIASGFNNAVSRIAGMLAIAIMGVVVVQLWQSALMTAQQGSPEGVRSALESVYTQAFVIPDTTGVGAEQAEMVERLSRQAAADAFRNGMLLAALLVALGGVISAVTVRNRRDASAAQEARP